jgi:hypothetical protein
MWVDEVTVAGKWIYALMHGHNMGSIVRTPMPAHSILKKGVVDELPTVTKQYRIMAEALSKVEVVVDDAAYSGHFCVCEHAGKPLLFYTSKSTMMLSNGNGEWKDIGHLPDE